MDPTVLIGIGTLLLVLTVVGLVVFIVVQDHQRVMAEAKGRSEGLKIGSDAIQQVVNGQLQQVDGQVEATKGRDPVDVANELIAGAKKP